MSAVLVYYVYIKKILFASLMVCSVLQVTVLDVPGSENCICRSDEGKVLEGETHCTDRKHELSVQFEGT